MNRHVTVLIPVHNEAENIAPLCAELKRELADTSCRVVVINDGSTDDTDAELARHAPDWTVLTTSHVGKSRALELGLEKVDTDQVVMMDGDLQDDTASIPALLAELDAGADCAVGYRARRRDDWLVKKLPSRFFNLFLSLLFGFRFLDINTGLKAFRTDSLRRIRWFENCHRFLPLLVFRTGGRIAQVPTRHRPRFAGSAKFNSPFRFLGGFAQAVALRLGWQDPAPRSVRVARLLPLLVAVLCGATFFQWAALDGWFIHTDAPAFVPPMLSHAHDEGLLNTYQPSALFWDPLHEGRQIGHGFLPSLVYGALSPGMTYQSIHYAMAGIASLALLLFAGLLTRLVAAPTALRGLVPAFGVFAAALMFWRLQGRPEVFVFFIICLSGRLWLSLGLTGRLLVAGLGLSAIAVTSPVAALLTGTLLLAWCVNRPPAEGVRALCLIGSAVVAGIVLWFALYPYPVGDWFRGHLKHAATTVIPVRREALPLLWHWAFRLLDGLPGVWLALGAIAGLGLAFRHLKPLAWAGPLLFLAVAWYFGLRQGISTYNLDWLAPLALIPIAHAIATLSARSRSVAACVLASLCAVQAYAFTARQIKIRQGLINGPAPSEVSRAAEVLASASPGQSIYLSRHFFQLLEPRKTWVRYYESGSFPLAKETDAGFFLSQAEARAVEPPELPGWDLVANNFLQPAKPGSRLRVPYSSLGFAYALYLPAGIEPPPALSALLAQDQATGNESRDSNQ